MLILSFASSVSRLPSSIELPRVLRVIKRTKKISVAALNKVWRVVMTYFVLRAVLAIPLGRFRF
ncbi:hypothetical protein HNQ57_003453, partial [Zhongshania antarctica]